MSVNFPQSSQNDETCKNKNINEIDSNYSNNNNNITEPKSSNDNNNINTFNSNNLLDNDDESNLKFHSKLILQLENTPQQYKNQSDYKYSIDLQNNDKKIHELTADIELFEHIVYLRTAAVYENHLNAYQ